ncbi:D,D-dipeptide ABC transporter permease, partial [Roseomonas sp. DSM 102946]|nr:D,D-dipeptide ABC transporter permease [Roseomonas sp. DSM 102946]
MTAKTFSRAWLLSPAPESRRQAAWGQRYQAWLAFRRNPLAMAGLIVVVLLLALSLLAPVLATHDPNIQDLANRLQPWSAQHWLGTDELGRDVYSRLLYGGRITLGMVV